MVNHIDIQVNATGNFSQLNAQIAQLKAAVAQLQSKPLLGDSGRATAAQLAQIQTQFDKMLLSTRAFNVETVKMSNSIDNFGNRLQAGKLHFSEYARIYRQTVKGMSTELDSLADSQARVSKSVVLPDALRTGYAKVITNLTSDLKSLNAAEEAAIIKTKALNSVIHGMGTSLVNMGKNTQWAGRQLTVGLTVPVAAFGAMAAKAFKDVNTELTRMQRMYGTGLSLPSEQEIAKVSTAIIDLSKKVAENMGIAQKETVTAAANFAAVGTTGDALIVATEQAMRLSKLGAVNADTAQKTITSLQTTFKVGTKDVAEAVNFLNDIQKQTSTDLQDLTDAIPRVGPIVSQLGGTYKDTAVMMVAMKEAGVPAAQSANAIKSAVASMIGPTRQARDEFEKYGISLTKIKDDTQGNPIEMIEALQTSLKKLSPLVQAQLIEKLFGKFQFARVTALINNLGAAGSQTQNAFLVAKASVSELARLADSEMKIATESTTAKWSRALEGFKATLLPLGEKFMKFGTKVLDFFSKIMHFLDRFKPLENLLVNVLGGAALVGPVLMLVGLFGNLAGNIIKGVNYFRMFAQGAKDGGILAGFKSMANFFEMINIETLASSKNMDGLTTSTQKTVEAFAVLNQEIGIMTRSLNEVFARSTRMPIVASPYAQQTLAQLQAINPEYVGGTTKGLERPHMFPAARLWEGWAANEGNIQGRVPTLNAFLQNRALNPTMEAQENFIRGGMPEQWGAPVPSGGLAAQLQKEYGTEDVIHGPKFGLAKEDVYSRGFQKIENIRNKILDGRIAADSKIAIELAKIDAFPEEQKVQALTQVIQKVTFTEEQYFNNLIESLVQTQALLTAPEEMLKAVDTKVKTVLADPTIENKSVAIQAILTEFNADFKLLGGTVVEEITKYRTLVQQTILSTTSTFETAIAAANFRAGIVASAEMFGGVRKGALGRFVSMDKQALSQSVLMARDIPKGFQTGGAIHAQDGVWVPGSGSGDRVPAMLEPGEFVVNRNAAKQYGGLLEHLNWNAAPRFGTGGKNPSSVPVGMRGYQDAGEVEAPKVKAWVPKDLLGLSKGENLFWHDISYAGSQFQKLLLSPILDQLRKEGYDDAIIQRIKNSFNSDRNLRSSEDRFAASEALSAVIRRGNPYGIDLRMFSEDSRGKIMGAIENERLRTHQVHDFKYFDPNAPVRFTSNGGMPSAFRDLRRWSFDEAYGGDVNWVRKLVPSLAENYLVSPFKAQDYLLEKHGSHTMSMPRAPRIMPVVRKKGGGIPGYQSGITPAPSMKSLTKEEQDALMKEYIQKTMRPSSALSLLQEQISSAVTPTQLELMQRGYGHEILQSNPKLAKLLEEYTFNTKSFVLQPGYLPQKTKFDFFNTLGKDEKFLLGMSKTQFETWQPTSMFSTSERSPLFTRTLAQAIKEQGRGIGSIGIVPEELDLSPFSQKMYENLRKRGMPIETSGREFDFRPNLYSQNDVGLEDSRKTTKYLIDKFLRRVTTNDFFNNSFTYRSTGEGPLSSVLNRAYVEQTDVQHRIPEIEARATMMRFLRQGLLKQKGGGIPGYEEGGGPTWMARGNPYTEAQFQKSLESWIRPVLHGMAPWNNPEKDTYRPMGETYKGFYKDIFNDQMRNIGRQDLLRAMVADNVKGGQNMHPWITSLVNAADDRYYPEGWMSESGNRVPPMANYQGPWEASTTRPFTSFTDIKDTDFLKKRFMPSFSDKRFWNAMVRGNKLPFFFHAMTGPKTMGLPVSKLFAGQTYYGNEGEYVLPQGQK
jgi:TP901 family phage tail tape measure protein